MNARIKTIKNAMTKTALHARLRRLGGPAQIPAKAWNKETLARTVLAYQA